VKTKHYGVTSAGLPYMVMEMLRGHDVEVELAQNGPMDPVRLLPMFTACLDGLGQAHATGIVHKDLKPANLFIDVSDPSRERLKVVDFGIARMGQAEEVRLTQTGQPVCTPGYAAPEYVTHLRATAAVDVYQMALILVEMLCGDPVVEDRNPLNCIMRHVKGDLTLPPSLMESPLGAVLRKALALKDTDRYPDCSAFSKALRQIDPRQLQGDSEGTQTLKVDRHELSWARSLVAALIVAQKTPDDIERLEPLVRSCVRHGQWKVSGKEWHRLREMIKGAIGRATALNKTAAVRRFESLELELEQHLGRLR